MRNQAITGTIGRQAASAEDVQRAIDTLLGVAIGEREITLKVAHKLKGYSPASLLRRQKYDPDWHDATYAVGETGSDVRTTINRIKRCEDRAAARAAKKVRGKDQGNKRDHG